MKVGHAFILALFAYSQLRFNVQYSSVDILTCDNHIAIESQNVNTLGGLYVASSKAEFQYM